jgi:hypothetical protein
VSDVEPGPPGTTHGASPYVPGEAELKLLHKIRMAHLGHVSYREVDPQTRKVTYVAYGLTIEVHPHSIVTTDLAELAAQLDQRAAPGKDES